MSTPEIIGKEQQPHQVIEVITAAIDLYYEHILNPETENSLAITAKDEQANGTLVQESYTIQQVYGTAYFIKCVRSNLTSFGANSPILAEHLDTVEFRLLPALFERGQVNIQHIDASRKAVQTEIAMDDLATSDPEATSVLNHLQLNLLALLVGHSKQRDLFDPLPVATRELLTSAYGQEAADQLWQAGMSDAP